MLQLYGEEKGFLGSTMNNRFLFRIYNKKNKCWKHGPGYEVHLFGEFMLMGEWMNNVALEELEDYQILQYTGQKDKKGSKIFEGDILRGKMDFGPAGWNVVTLPVYFDNEKGYQWSDWELTSLEVVGNVFDNPELLL